MKDNPHLKSRGPNTRGCVRGMILLHRLLAIITNIYCRMGLNTK